MTEKLFCDFDEGGVIEIKDVNTGIDRLVIDIEDENVELSIYHHDTFKDFDMFLATNSERVEFKMSDNEARNMANAILNYLDDKIKG